eukprot:GDKJ01036875.1.p1 GENE.GDKJ01036875.1~~GDKJ01036875.1.p1  ORF type:complete len:143 (+),score=12.61 GDKJ01036875.1:109-537(+)
MIEDPVVTPCGHMYCWKCLSEWLGRGQNTCPTCKGVVTEDNVIPVYMGGSTPATHSKFKERPKARRVPGEDTFEGQSQFMFTFGIFPFSLILPFLSAGPYDAIGDSDEPPLTPTRRMIRQTISNILLILLLIPIMTRFLEFM